MTTSTDAFPLAIAAAESGGNPPDSESAGSGHDKEVDCRIADGLMSEVPVSCGLDQQILLDTSNTSDSCPAEPDPARETGGGAACGSIPAANDVGTSRCGGSDPANSGRRDGRLNAPDAAGRGRRPAVEHGEGTGIGIAAETGTASAVEGHEQKGAVSYRKEKAAKGNDTSQTKRRRKSAPGGRDAARSIGMDFPVDSPVPDHSATSFPRNEETPTGLSGCLTASGEGDPPHGRSEAGRPTKQMSRRNRGNTQNSVIGSQEDTAQQPSSEPTKQEVQSANWAAVDWSRVEARVFHTQRAIHEAQKQDNIELVHRLQLRLAESFNSKLLAVRHATEDSRGKDTPGTDGLASLTDAQKWVMATLINIDIRPHAIKRVTVPKPGKKERRPLGIPAIRDRAVQHLVKLALEPAVEALLAPEQFGFRPGRSCQDAAMHLRLRLRNPAHVLDADIRSFFDRLNHDAVLGALPGPSSLRKAVRRLLKAGILDGVSLTEPDAGTPQGSPLSPLLANLVLSGLPAAIRENFPAMGNVGDERIGKPPYTAIYADDLIVIHPSENVLREVQVFLQSWLTHWGLELHPEKTKIRNTATLSDGIRGFEFLGFNFRHHRIGKNQGGKRNIGNRGLRGPRWFLWSGPSKVSLKRVYAKCVEIIRGSNRSRKRHGEILDKARKGQSTPEEIMVTRLNAQIRGWTGYHRTLFAKEAFSKLDYKVFLALFRHTRRRHRRRPVEWVIRRYYGGATRWSFGITSAHSGKRIGLVKAAETAIQRHFPVKAEKSWFDGDWASWAKRVGHYPMLTRAAGGKLKTQNGKCPVCGLAFTVEDRVVIGTMAGQGNRRQRRVLAHRECADALQDVQTDSVFARRATDRSPVQGNLYAGFEGTTDLRISVVPTTAAAAPDGAPAQTSLGGLAPDVGGSINSGATSNI